jgi:hypothetical protein
MTHVLDNITWHSLTGPHAKYAAGTDDARRYATGFSPIVGFADVERPNFDALRPYCEVGEHFYCEGWLGSAAHGWQIDAETTLFKMVWDARPCRPPMRAFKRAYCVHQNMQLGQSSLPS